MVLLGLMTLASTLTVQPAGIAVWGEVRTADATVVAGAVVTVVCPDTRRVVVSDDSGRFRADGVPAEVPCEVRAEWPERAGGGSAVARVGF